MSEGQASADRSRRIDRVVTTVLPILSALIAIALWSTAFAGS
jgi:hypothetical protein